MQRKEQKMKKHEQNLLYLTSILLLVLGCAFSAFVYTATEAYSALGQDYTVLAQRLERLDMPTAQVPPKESELQTEAPVITPQYGFDDTEIYLLTQLLCGGTDYYGDGEYDIDYQIDSGKTVNEVEVWKVLGVVMNRVNSSKFPDTIKEVVFAPRQFSVMPRNAEKAVNEASLAYVRTQLARYDMRDPTIPMPPANHLYFEMGPNITNITKTTWK
jgi:hypothetical protein